MRELRQNWLDIFSAFRIAIDPKKMMLGFFGGLVSLAVLFGLLYAFRSAFPNGLSVASGFLRDPVRGFASMRLYSTPSADTLTAEDTSMKEVLSHHLAPSQIGPKEIGFLMVGGVIMLLIWSYVGGMIMRSASVEFSKDDRIDWREASAFALKKFSSFFWAPLVPCIGIAFLLLCVYVGGLFGRVPYVGPVADGIFFFLALLAGFLIVLIALGTLFGAPLMGPTIAMEGTDAFDAISRSFAYIYGRPWRYIWYYAAGLAYALVCTAFVAVFACAVIHIVVSAIAGGMGQAFDPIKTFVINNRRDEQATFVQNLSAVLMKAWIIATWGLVVGFFISMKLTLDTIIYSLLRKDVDGTDMTEVFIEEEEEEGLPPPEGEAPAAPPSADQGSGA